MKKIVMFVLNSTFLVLTINSFAKDVCNFYPGVLSCGSGVKEHLISNGIANLDGTKMTEMTINGALMAKNITVDHGTINGGVRIKNSTIMHELTINGMLKADHIISKGVLTINGLLTAKDSTFNQLNIHSHKLYLDHSKLKTIAMRRGDDSDDYAVIYLKDHSIVYGDITFENPNGRVALEDGSQVKGKIINGVVSQN